MAAAQFNWNDDFPVSLSSIYVGLGEEMFALTLVAEDSSGMFSILRLRQ